MPQLLSHRLRPVAAPAAGGRGARGRARCEAAAPLAAAVLAGVGLAACSDSPEIAAMQRGQRLLAQHQCGTCHVVPGVPGAAGRQAVSLQGFGARSYIAGQLPNEPYTLVRWIRAPASLIPGTSMPDMGVNEDDARDMAAYLKSLQ